MNILVTRASRRAFSSAHNFSNQQPIHSNHSIENITKFVEDGARRGDIGAIVKGIAAGWKVPAVSRVSQSSSGPSAHDVRVSGASRDTNVRDVKRAEMRNMLKKILKKVDKTIKITSNFMLF